MISLYNARRERLLEQLNATANVSEQDRLLRELERLARWRREQAEAARGDRMTWARALVP